MKRSLSIAGIALAAALASAPPSPARDLSVVRNWTGQYFVYGADGSGFHRAPIDLLTVDDVQVTGGLATIKGENNHALLYGMTPKGIVTRRIDLEMGGAVSSMHQGDRIALAKGTFVHGIYGVTDREIQAELIYGEVRDVALEQNLLYLVTDRGRFLYGVAQDRLARRFLGLGPGAPDEIMLARNQAVIRVGNRVELLYLNEDGFHRVRLDEAGQPPDQLFVGGYSGHTIHPGQGQSGTQTLP